MQGGRGGSQLRKEGRFVIARAIACQRQGQAGYLN